jgi:hypothetical protein
MSERTFTLPPLCQGLWASVWPALETSAISTTQGLWPVFGGVGMMPIPFPSLLLPLRPGSTPGRGVGMEVNQRPSFIAAQ